MLCNRGGPVKNTVLAENLWPDFRKENAMDNLYKVIRSIKNMWLDGHSIPVLMEHGEVYLDRAAYSCDLTEFEQFYQEKHDMAKCAAAVELYRGNLLYDEAYDWVAPYEAYYDIRFLEMAERLTLYYASIGNSRLENYYRSRTENGFSE